MEITDGLICYRILYQSTTRENIGQWVPIDVTRDRRQTLKG